MRNWEKLHEIFPHALTMRICPAMLYGRTVCPFKENQAKKNDLMNTYDIKDAKCEVCSKMFWKSEYDGADDIELQVINTKRIRKCNQTVREEKL